MNAAGARKPKRKTKDRIQDLEAKLQSLYRDHEETKLRILSEKPEEKFSDQDILNLIFKIHEKGFFRNQSSCAECKCMIYDDTAIEGEPEIRYKEEKQCLDLISEYWEKGEVVIGCFRAEYPDPEDGKAPTEIYELTPVVHIPRYCHRCRKERGDK